MSEHPNVARMREGYEAFGKGDLEALREFLTDDVVWHVAGRSPMAGDYEGVDTVFAFFGQVFELTGGSFRVEPLTLLANDEYGAAPVKVTAHREDRHLDLLNVQTSRMRDGRVAEFWETTTDPAAVDEFWA